MGSVAFWGKDAWFSLEQVSYVGNPEDPSTPDFEPHGPRSMVLPLEQPSVLLVILLLLQFSLGLPHCFIVSWQATILALPPHRQLHHDCHSAASALAPTVSSASSFVSPAESALVMAGKKRPPGRTYVLDLNVRIP